jgi:hypothetical protein
VEALEPQQEIKRASRTKLKSYGTGNPQRIRIGEWKIDPISGESTRKHSLD